MNIERGCKLLERSLDELLERAGTVGISVARVRNAANGFAGPVDVPFHTAAHYVADTLSDVARRLAELDEVLISLREQP